MFTDRALAPKSSKRRSSHIQIALKVVDTAQPLAGSEFPKLRSQNLKIAPLEES